LFAVVAVVKYKTKIKNGSLCQISNSVVSLYFSFIVLMYENVQSC